MSCITLVVIVYLKIGELFVLESRVEKVFYIQDPRSHDWEFIIKTQPRDLYDMPDKDSEEQVVDVNAYQQVQVDVEGYIFRHANDDYLINSWSTNDFVVEKGTSVVKMVQNDVRKSDKDNDFVDDGDIEDFHNLSEEEEEFDYNMSQDEA